ncbi:TerB family tellurite resistance protein [Maribacter sp.]|nr:TerB family tellurite resistance protein [Maribacter sp.]
MELDVTEKLAFVKMIDSVIQIDGEVHEGEIKELNFLMHRLNFDVNFIYKAQKLEQGKSLEILKAMPQDKKIVLGGVLIEMANADGFIHIKEVQLISEICATIGIDFDMD